MFQSGGELYLPKFGTISPESILRIVDLPIPFCPNKPRTNPEEGAGRWKSANELGPKRWLQPSSSSSGKFTMERAPNGHFLTQMPHPIQDISETIGFPSSNLIVSMLFLTLGQNLWHILPQRLDLHLSDSKTAILNVIFLLDTMWIWLCGKDKTVLFTTAKN